MRANWSSSKDGGLYGAGGWWISRPEGMFVSSEADDGINWVFI
jgi:hypothetical protein